MLIAGESRKKLTEKLIDNLKQIRLEYSKNIREKINELNEYRRDVFFEHASNQYIRVANLKSAKLKKKPLGYFE